MRCSWLAVALGCWGLVLSAEGSSRLSNETLLKQWLLSEYDPDSTPTGGTVVELQVSLYQMKEISTPLQEIKFQGWWRNWWSDSRLQWSAEQWGVSSVLFPLNEIWAPDQVIYEKTESDELGSPVAVVYPTGEVFYSTPRLLTTGCLMELSTFPFDTQICRFTVGSVSYDGNRMDLVPRGVAQSWFKDEPDGDAVQSKAAVDLTDYEGNPEFALSRVRIISRNRYYTCCPEPYPLIIFELELERQALTYVSGIVIPLIAVTSVGFLSLLMPAPLSGARPAFSISVLFTTTSIYLVASRKMPEVGSWTLIGRLYLASLVANVSMVFVSVISTSLNLILSEEKAARNDLISQFRYFDSDKTGHLSFNQIQAALTHMGLTEQERLWLVTDFGVDDGDEIDMEDWVRLATLAKKYRPPGQYNIAIGWFLNKINGTNSGKSAKLAPEKKGSQKQAQQGPDAAIPMISSDFEYVAASPLVQNSPYARTPRNGNNGNHDIHGAAFEEPKTYITTPLNNISAVDYNEGSSTQLQDVRLNGTPNSRSHLLNSQTPHSMPTPHSPQLSDEPSQMIAADKPGAGFVVDRGGKVNLQNSNAQLPLKDRRDLPSPLKGASRGKDEDFQMQPKLVQILNRLDIPVEVQAKFARERITLEALQYLHKAELAELGVSTLGQQSMLIGLAKEEHRPHVHEKRDSVAASGRRDSINSPRHEGNGGPADMSMEARRKQSMARKNSGVRELHWWHMHHNSSIRYGDPQHGFHTPREPHPAHAHGKALAVKMFGPLMDWYSLLLFPTGYFVYVITEFAGGITGKPVVWRGVPSANVITTIELADERTLENQELCYSNIQNIAKAVHDSCKSVLGR